MLRYLSSWPQSVFSMPMKFRLLQLSWYPDRLLFIGLLLWVYSQTAYFSLSSS